MLKSILGVIVGYIVMAIFSFAAFTCAYLGLGVDRVFEPDSYNVSAIWIVIMIIIALVGGIAGLFFSYWWDLPSGAAIVCTFGALLLAVAALALIRGRLRAS